MSAVRMIVHVRDGADDPPFPGDTSILAYAGDEVFQAMVDYRGNRDLADWQWYGEDVTPRHPPLPDVGGLWVLDGSYVETCDTDYTAPVEGVWRRPTDTEIRRLADGLPVWGEDEP